MRMTINLPEATVEIIKQKAIDRGQSASSYITQVMEVHLKEEKKGTVPISRLLLSQGLIASSLHDKFRSKLLA